MVDAVQPVLPHCPLIIIIIIIIIIVVVVVVVVVAVVVVVVPHCPLIIIIIIIIINNNITFAKFQKKGIEPLFNLNSNKPRYKHACYETTIR